MMMWLWNQDGTDRTGKKPLKEKKMDFIAYRTACFDVQSRKLEWDVIKIYKAVDSVWADESTTVVYQIPQDLDWRKLLILKLNHKHMQKGTFFLC